MQSRNKKNKFLKLSEPQRMIFLNDKLYPNTSLSTICVTSNLGSSCDLSSIKLATTLVVKENPGLHIRVKSLEGIPYQYLDYVLDYKITVIDFNDIGGEEYEKQWLDAEICRVFKLDGSPLFKIYLYYSTDGNLYLLISTHHIISDAWSHQTLTEQISSKYQEIILNQTPVHSPKYSYLDYLETEKDYLSSSRCIKSRDFWRNKFSSLKSLPKPIKNFNSGVVSDAKRYRRFFNNSTQEKILDLCKEFNIGYSNFFLSCLLVVLKTISDSESLLLGTLTYNRLGKKEKEGVGMFVNTLPMLFSLKDDISFLEIVELVNLELAGLMRHQRYPLNYLTNDIEVRDLNIAGNLDILYSYQNVILPYEYNYHFSNHSSYPILFRPTRMGEDGKFYLDVDYQVNSFSDTEVLNFTEIFIKVIDSLELDNIDKSFDLKNSALKKLKPLEITNDEKRIHNLNQTLHGLYEKKAFKYKDKNAVSYNGLSLTYWELNRRANFLAKELLFLGAGNETPVVLILDRSLEMMIAILAVLKTGSCYLPLSTEQPSIRIKKIINLSEAKIIIHNKDLGSEYNDSKLVDIRNIVYPQGEIHNLDIPVKPTNLAYIIYTSGSTGEPKGVMVEHKSVLNRLLWMQNKFPLYENDVVMQKTPYTFDVSVWELFGWYVSGSSLHFLKPGGEKEPVTIVDEVHREGVTIIHFVPSMLTLFLEYLDSGGSMDHIKSLRRFNCSGEAILKSHTERFYSIFNPSIELFNLYGPTEATVEVTLFDCRNNENSFVPIGKPIDNTSIYILDSDGKVLPEGISGELHIGGVCLARGYFKSKELTESKFKDHPSLNKRLYSTGDLAKYMEDGNIQYLGRIDNQVKIRGNRVELGEIESCILKFPGILEAACVAPKDSSGNTFLGAYFVSNLDIPHEEIRSFIKKHLPSYMIPSFFSQLTEFPLTSSGKLDRKKLPIPKRDKHRKVYYAPINDREEEVCEAWEEVLKVENISRSDNFFDLGGDSLKLIKVHFLLQDKYEVSLQDLFEFQTIETLAQHIKLRNSNLLTYNKDEYHEILSERHKQNRISSYHDNVNSLNLAESVDYHSILITGATGFLGAYITREYIYNSEATLYLLVRGANQEDSEIRFWNKMKFYFGESFITNAAHRIRVVNGDIVKNHLGSVDYNYLKDEIESVIHCAANVKHFGERHEVNLINIRGTENIISFCRDSKPKVMSFVSTMSVGLNNIGNDSFFNEYDFPEPINNGNVYLDSKVMAEKLVVKSSKELKAKILRVGNLVIDSQSGIFQENFKDNGFYNLMMEYKKLGFIPDINSPFIDLSPVNDVAKAIFKLTNSTAEGVYHLYNPNLRKLSDLFKSHSTRVEPLKNFMNRITYGNPILVHGHYLKNIKLLGITNYNLKTNVVLKSLGFKWSLIDDDFIEMLWESWELCDNSVKITNI